MSEFDTNLITFRLDELEKKLVVNFKEMYNKIDAVLKNQTDNQIQLALEMQRRERLERDVVALESQVCKNTEAVTAVRISLAEKVGYGLLGGVGGGTVAGIIQLLSWFMAG